MCGKDTAAAVSTMNEVPAVAPPRKLRTIAQLRCEFWNRKTAALGVEHGVEDQDLSPTTASSSAFSSESSEIVEQKPRLKSLEDLMGRFQQRQAKSLQGKEREARHSREALLAARQVLERTDIGIRCVKISREVMPAALPKATRYTQDPRLDDDSLLVQMEERLSREAGADVKNEETFGKDSEQPTWSYEEAVEANRRLLSTPLKPCHVKDYASTAAGSRSHSSAPSSEVSTPRAPGAAAPAATVKGLSADAAPFFPGFSADAAPFCPEAFSHSLATEAENWTL